MRNIRSIITSITAMAMILSMLLPFGPAALASGENVTKDIIWSKAKSLAQGELTVQKGKTLTLDAPITITGKVTISGGGVIKRGNKLDERSAMFIVKDNGNLTLRDITLDGGGIWPRGMDSAQLSARTPEEVGQANTGISSLSPVVCVNGVLNIGDGAAIRNNFNMSDSVLTYAGAVVIGQVRGDSGTVNMDGGSISNNYSAMAAGGVSINSENAVFNMSAGRLRDNAASAKEGSISVGGVLNLGNFNMSGGAIAANAGGQVGGVYDGSENGIDMSGGLIDGYNKATGPGQTAGGIFAGNLLGEIVLSGDALIDADINLGTDETNMKHIRLKDGVDNSLIVTPPSYEDGAIIAKGWNTHTITEDDVKRMIIPTDYEGNQWYAVLDGKQAVMKQGDSPYKYSEVYLGGGPEPSDENAGISLNSSVASFEKAKELLEKDGTIYIGGEVVVTGHEEWSLPKEQYGDAMLKRLPEGQGGAAGQYEGALVEVKPGAQLTLKDITLDGGAEWESLTDTAVQAENKGINLVSENAEAMIKSSGNLMLDNGTVLRNADAGQSEGGAVRIEGGSLEMKLGSAIRNNRANSGAGIYAAKGSQVHIDGGSLEGNSASDTAGALYSDGSLSMKEAQVLGNAAENAGGVYSAGSANIESTSFENNKSSQAGGALLLADEANINNTEFKDNNGGEGGAVYLQEGAQAEVTNTQVQGNSAGMGGGFYVAEDSRLLLGDKTSVQQNNSTWSGGGIYQEGQLQVAGDVDVSKNKLLVFDSDVYLADEDNVIEVVEPLTGEGSIGVNAAISKDNGRQLASSADEQPLSQQQADKIISNAINGDAPVWDEQTGKLAIPPKDGQQHTGDTTSATAQPTTQPTGPDGAVPTMTPILNQPIASEQPEPSEEATKPTDPQPEVSQDAAKATPEPESSTDAGAVQADAASNGQSEWLSGLFSGIAVQGLSGGYLGEDDPTGSAEPSPSLEQAGIFVEVPKFQAQQYGYGDIAPKPIVVENIGNVPFTIEEINLLGQDKNYFEFEEGAFKPINPGETLEVGTIAPKNGLNFREQPYEVTVSVYSPAFVKTHEKTIKFQVEKQAVDKYSILHESIEASYEYTGQQIKPVVEPVKIGEKTLTKNIDYTITYGANINAGSGSIEILLKGNYEGSRTITFAIEKKLISGPVSVSLQRPQTNEIAQTVFSSGNENYSVEAEWSGGKIIDGRFEASKQYTLKLSYKSNANYKFAMDFEATADGEPTQSGSRINDGLYELYVEFPMTFSAPVSNMTLVNDPLKMIYKEGDRLDLSGLKVKLEYGEGEEETLEYKQFGHRVIILFPEFSNGTKVTYNDHHNKVIDLWYAYDTNMRTRTNKINVQTNNTGVRSIHIRDKNKNYTLEMKAAGQSFRLILPEGEELPTSGNSFKVVLADVDSTWSPIDGTIDFTNWWFEVKSSSGHTAQYNVTVSSVELEREKNQKSVDEAIRRLKLEFPPNTVVPANITSEEAFAQWLLPQANAVLYDLNIKLTRDAIKVIRSREPIDGSLQQLKGEAGLFEFDITVSVFSAEEYTAGSTLVTGTTGNIVFVRPAKDYVPKPKVKLKTTAGNEVMSGQEFFITAEIEDIYLPQYQWYKSSSYTNQGGLQLGGHTSADFRQVGSYVGSRTYFYVEVTGVTTPKIVSEPIEIIVVLSKPTITLDSGGQFLLGTDTTIVAKVTDPEGGLSYQWIKDSVEIPGADSTELILEDLQPEDAGDYKLRVTKTVKGSDYSETTDSINYKLTVVKPDESVPGNNTISGINEWQEFKANTKINFTATGANMSLRTPKIGNLRYRPDSWSVNPSGTFPVNGPYTASFSIENTGEYQLKIVFNEQVYDGKAWIDTGETATETVNLTIKDGEAKTTASPSPSPGSSASPSPGPGSSASPSPSPAPGATASPSPGPSNNGNGDNNDGDNNTNNNNGGTASPTPASGANGDGDTNGGVKTTDSDNSTNGGDTTTKSGDGTDTTASPTPSAGTGSGEGTPTPTADDDNGTAGTSGVTSGTTPSPTDNDYYTGDLIHVPRTGDENALLGWIFVMIVAAGTVWAVIYANRQAIKKDAERTNK